MSSYGTKFPETEAVLAAQDGDEDACAAIVATMTPTARLALLAAIGTVTEQARRYCGNCGTEFDTDNQQDGSGWINGIRYDLCKPCMDGGQIP